MNSWKSFECSSLDKLRRSWGLKPKPGEEDEEQLSTAEPNSRFIDPNERQLDAKCEVSSSLGLPLKKKKGLNFLSIPTDVLIHTCFPYLGTTPEIGKLMCVCTSWAIAAQDSSLWKGLYIRKFLGPRILSDIAPSAEDLPHEDTENNNMAHVIVTSQAHFANLCSRGRRKAVDAIDIPLLPMGNISSGRTPSMSTNTLEFNNMCGLNPMHQSCQQKTLELEQNPATHFLGKVFKDHYFLCKQTEVSERSIRDWEHVCRLGKVWEWVLHLLRQHMFTLLNDASQATGHFEMNERFSYYFSDASKGLVELGDDSLADSILRAFRRLSLISQGLLSKCLQREIQMQAFCVSRMAVSIIQKIAKEHLPLRGTSLTSSWEEGMMIAKRKEGISVRFTNVVDTICDVYCEWKSDIMRCASCVGSSGRNKQWSDEDDVIEGTLLYTGAAKPVPLTEDFSNESCDEEGGEYSDAFPGIGPNSDALFSTHSMFKYWTKSDTCTGDHALHNEKIEICLGTGEYAGNEVRRRVYANFEVSKLLSSHFEFNEMPVAAQEKKKSKSTEESFRSDISSLLKVDGVDKDTEVKYEVHTLADEDIAHVFNRSEGRVKREVTRGLWHSFPGSATVRTDILKLFC